MKRIVPGVAALAVIAVVGLFYLPREAQLASAEISVPDLKCNNCVDHVSAALQQVEGVVETSVNLEEKMVRVTFDPEKTRKADLVQAIQDAGYGKTKEHQDCEATSKRPAESCDTGTDDQWSQKTRTTS